MSRIEARRRNASAVRLRFSQSLVSLRQRLSHASVRSTIQRLGSTTNPLACSQVRQDFFERVVELAPLIAGVSKQCLQERIHPEQGCKQQDAAVAILDVSGMDDGVEQQTQRIYQNVALLALDLLARIIAMRIDAGPPFSALFTLWLSRMAAVGLASRSACSRHAT